MKIRERIEKWRRARKERQCRQIAESIFQVREYNGKFWLTKHGDIVLPATMLKIDIIDALADIRQEYYEFLINQ